MAFSRDRAFKRVHFSREREYFQERIQEGVLVFKLGFQTPPNGCLDQLDPMLALGAALFLHPINKSTCHGQSHCPNFTFSLQSILLDVDSITRI